MLGWLIIIYRQKADGTPDKEQEVAKWDTRLNGRDWLERLSELCLIRQTKRNGGYPFKYEGPTQAILSLFEPEKHPDIDPQALDGFCKSWGSRGNPTADKNLIHECLKTSEMLSIAAWDLD